MNHPKLELVNDYIAEQLDELSDLCEHWKRNREKGRTPYAIRAALLMVCNDLARQDELNRRDEMKRALQGKGESR